MARRPPAREWNEEAISVVPWWSMWEGIIAEYWDGAWRLTIEDLGGDVAIAMTVPVQDHLLIAIDRLLLQVFAEAEELTQITTALRLLLNAGESLNTPGLFAGLPLSPSLKHLRSLWVGAPYRQTLPETSRWARRRQNYDRFEDMD